jgi:hypothetical protein
LSSTNRNLSAGLQFLSEKVEFSLSHRAYIGNINSAVADARVSSIADLLSLSVLSAFSFKPSPV